MPQLVTSPGDILLHTDGDAFKNYYTFLYHSLYGDGLWFDGMNYPYGEHVFFADAQPLLSVPLSYFKILPPLIVFHWAIVIGYVLSIVFVYKVLLRFNVNWVWALVFSPLIVIMSPQLFKLTGHYSLAYLCVLPMVFYYHLSYHQTKQRKYAVHLLISSIVFALLHIYFAAMICFWIGAYSIAYLVVHANSLKDKVKYLSPLWLAAFIPIIFIKTILWLTDSTLDRPDYPYGARQNRTYLEDIYSGHISPISNWIRDIGLTETISNGKEGIAYIGVAAILILISALIFVIVKRKRLDFRGQQSLSIWIFIALTMLVFATSIIFIKCFKCLDYAYGIKQFRAVGRFAWAYYYIATIASAVILYRTYQRISNKFVANSLLVAVLAIWLTEAIPYVSWSRYLGKHSSRKYENHLKEDAWIKGLNKYFPNDFQGILMLPYVHVGTEKIGPGASNTHLLAEAFSASLQLNLPLVDVMMSRSGWQQAFGQARISGGIYTHKPLLRNLPNDKPLLLLSNDVIKLTPDEVHLLAASTYIGKVNNNEMYALYPQELKQIEEQATTQIKQVAVSMKIRDTCLVDSGTWYVEHFDKGESRNVLFSSGAIGFVREFSKTIFEKPISPMYDGQLYELSVWSLVPKKNYKIGRFNITLFDSSDNVLSQYKSLMQDATDTYSYWLRSNLFFKMPRNCARVQVDLINVIYPAFDGLDELMLRPTGATIVSKDKEGRIMANNHLLQ